jgi:hypothetical protein
VRFHFLNFPQLITATDGIGFHSICFHPCGPSKDGGMVAVIWERWWWWGGHSEDETGQLH